MLRVFGHFVAQEKLLLIMTLKYQTQKIRGDRQDKEIAELRAMVDRLAPTDISDGGDDGSFDYPGSTLTRSMKPMTGPSATMSARPDTDPM